MPLDAGWRRPGPDIKAAPAKWAWSYEGVAYLSLRYHHVILCDHVGPNLAPISPPDGAEA